MYSDGSCLGNPGHSGWGAVIIYPSGQIAEHSGYLGHGTNNSAEIYAFIEGVRRIDPKTPVTVHLDSRYVLDSLSKGWVFNWKRNNWKTAKGHEVANKEIWQKAIEIIKGRNITYLWVKGHSGDQYNDMADKLATTAVHKGKKEALSDTAI